MRVLSSFNAETMLELGDVVILRNSLDCSETIAFGIDENSGNTTAVHPRLTGCKCSNRMYEYALDSMGLAYGNRGERSGSWNLGGDRVVADFVARFNRDMEGRSDLNCRVDESLLCPLDVDEYRARMREDDFILAGYEDTKIYSGLSSYHASHSRHLNEPIGGVKAGGHRIGVELEVCATTQYNKRAIAQRRSNWFMMETDSSLDDYGIEIVTIPLLPKDAKKESTWEKLVEYLTPRAKSWQKSCCGLHVHIGREAFGKTEEERQSTIGKLLFLYYSAGLKGHSLNEKIYGRNRTYHESSFKSDVADAAWTLRQAVMKDKKVIEMVDKDLKSKAGETRYYDINLQNPATVEFRKGKGSICVERIISIITWCDEMVAYARKTDWSELSVDGFIAHIRKKVSKSNPIFRYLPTVGEES